MTTLRKLLIAQVDVTADEVVRLINNQLKKAYTLPITCDLNFFIDEDDEEYDELLVKQTHAAIRSAIRNAAILSEYSLLMTHVRNDDVPTGNGSHLRESVKIVLGDGHTSQNVNDKHLKLIHCSEAVKRIRRKQRVIASLIVIAGIGLMAGVYTLFCR